jgi:hypothetical protein
MTLSTLAILIGAVYSAIQIFALLRPDEFTKHARAFPRSEGIGFVLMGLGTAWFLYNLQAEAIADFAAYKKYMLLAFGAIGVLTCIFVRDFLAVRGLAVCLLLLAWFTLNRTRWADTPARLVLVVWAYTWVIGGMWLTISPWRLRDFLNWWTAHPNRLRIGAALQLALGVAVLVLGLTAFRQIAQ